MKGPRRSFPACAVALALIGTVACERQLLRPDDVVSGSDPNAVDGAAGAGSRGDGGMGSDSQPVSPLCPVLAEPASGAPSDPTPVPAGCFCTRRPGPANSYQCPVGVGQFNEAMIGPQGGTITLDGQQGQTSGVPFKIDFPPGALAQPTVVRVTETTIPPPSEFMDYSPVYRVDPQGTTLAVAAKMQIPWSNLSGGIPLTAIGTYALTDPTTAGGCAFTRVGDSYTNAGFEQSSLLRFGYYLVGVPRTDATANCP